MNLKHLFRITRYALLLAVTFGSAVVISSCDDDDGPTKFNGTILEMISDEKYQQAAGAEADVALDSLVKYLTVKDNSLADILGGPNEVTLFAPSNAAFAALLETPGFPDNIEDISPDLIAGVLGYHIVDGNLKKADLTADAVGTGLATHYNSTNPCTGAQTNQVISVNTDGTLLTGSTNANIDIVKSNLMANNGTVHITESVMIPPSVGESLTPILGKISATVLLGSDFTYLAQAMTKADCGVAGVTPLSNILSATGPYTVFLPPNPVFEGTAKAIYGTNGTVAQLIGGFTAAQWRNIILNHIVAGNNSKAQLTNGLQLSTMLTNGKLTVTDVPVGSSTPQGKILSTSGGTTGMGGTVQAPLIVVDIAHSNGTGHVVGKILIPN